MKDNIKTIIWDLDNTLYKFGENHANEWHKSVCHYMKTRQKLDIRDDHAFTLAEKGWLEHRNSNHYFIKDYNVNAHEAHVGIFEFLDQNMVSPCVETPTLMSAMDDYHHVILTYATREWAHKILDHTGLADFFHPDFILGAEDYNFEDKAHSPRGILTALDKIGGNANEVMFVEDTLPNLKTAKDHTDIKTTYLHHNRAVNDNDMGCVDLCVQDTPELLRWFKDIK